MFQIKNRFTAAVMFECELSAEVAGQEYRFQLGFAVKKAVEARADLSGAVLRDADLRDAVLSGADLSGADLSGAVLRDAVLSGADLRDAVLSDAVLSDAVLSDAVLSGADLSGAVLSDAVLSGADLSDAVLSGADLSGAVLRDADLSDAVLRDADLSGAVLRGAVLSGAVLRDAVLSGADWMPRIPNIHSAVYEAASAPEALDMGSWHNSCGTSHCRAGWVVTLAGAGGRVLEGVMGTPAAAALIYQASDPTLQKVPDFYCANEEALADMKRLAEAETAKNAAPKA